MYPTSFDYYRPQSVAEAIQLLRQHPGSKALAGGHSLLPQMKLRTSSPTALVDLGRIQGLSGISDSGGRLSIGAMATHTAIADSDLVKSACPILAEAAAQIGDVQVRNRGTIGGSLAHADPASDYPTVIVALGATLTATGPAGDRDLPAESFFTDLFTTALNPDELLTWVRVPKTGMPGMGGAYMKHKHPASGYAVVGVAALVGLEGGKCSRVSLVVGGTTANPIRAKAAEQMLTGQAPTAENVAAASAKVADAIGEPMGDLYASGEYRRHLATVLARRALMQAAQRAM
ncbi:MAG: xanthine dehydrogenase family protein subunit M [Armatimonadetes bacterium]|nr:xanthine dehydrogenase family protein subunit M [Armatimonadota bacterium]